MDDGDRAKLYLEMWKQTIDVQKHFNDIELRVRGLALTVLTFALGGASLALREGTIVRLLGLELRFSAVVLVAGAILWTVFYFVDQIWYHRLLMGAVYHGQDLERAMKGWGPDAGLTLQITKSSPYTLRFLKWSRNLHSRQKISIFYGSVLVLLLLLATMLQLSADPPTEPAGKGALALAGTGGIPTRW